MSRRLELNAWINSSGASDRSWPRRGLEADAIFTLDHYVNVARSAHRGVFSNIFMSDRPQLLIGPDKRPEQLFDPFVLFPAILAQVPDIGAIVTATTSYSEPYTLARAIQSLNLLFPGRIGWNVVTSWHPEIAANFSDRDLPDRAARYARAEEFVEIVLRLWDSWDYPWGAGDLKSHGAPAAIAHKGDHFAVRGPLNLPRAPWGHAKIVQAGGSQGGIALGACHADYIYSSLSSFEGSRAFRTELHSAARATGRREDDLPKLIPAFSPIIFSTEAEVAAFRRHHAEAHPVTEADLAAAAAVLGVDRGRTGDDTLLAASDFSDAVPSVVPVGNVNAKRRLALDGRHSLRSHVQAERIPGRPGTPESTAKFMREWFEGGAVDGFTISAPKLPDDLVIFVDEVVPILQDVGVYPRDYHGHHVGTVPENHHIARSVRQGASGPDHQVRGRHRP